MEYGVDWWVIEFSNRQTIDYLIPALAKRDNKFPSYTLYTAEEERISISRIERKAGRLRLISGQNPFSWKVSHVDGVKKSWETWEKGSSVVLIREKMVLSPSIRSSLRTLFNIFSELWTFVFLFFFVKHAFDTL